MKIIAEQLIKLNETMTELNENINYLTPLVDLVGGQKKKYDRD
jgi:hypothetical protein